MTPRDVRRRYSNGRDFDVVLRNGYKNRGIWAAKDKLARASDLGVVTGGEDTVEEEGTGIVVGCNALKESESIAHSVRRGCRELRWAQQRVDRNDFL